MHLASMILVLQRKCLGSGIPRDPKLPLFENKPREAQLISDLRLFVTERRRRLVVLIPSVIFWQNYGPGRPLITANYVRLSAAAVSGYLFF